MKRNEDQESAEEQAPDQRLLSDLNLVPPLDSHLGLVLMVVMVILVLLGLLLWFLGKMSWPTFYLLGGVALAALGIKAAAYFLLVGKLDADENGLILRPRWGEPKVVPYDAIIEVRAPGGALWATGDILHVADLITQDGVVLMLRYLEFEVLEVLKPVLLEKVACRLGDRMLARVRQGQEVSLREVTLDREGFARGEEAVQWDDVSLAHFTEEGLRIRFRDPTWTEMFLPRQTPNLHAFLHVLWTMQKQKALVKMGKGDSLAFLTDQADRPEEAEADFEDALRRIPRVPRIPGYPKADPDLGRLLFGMKQRVWMITGLVLAYLLMTGLLVFGFTMAFLGSPGWLGLWFFGTVILGAWAKDVQADSRNMGFAVYEGGLRTPRKKIRWTECHRLFLVVRNIYRSEHFRKSDMFARKETRLHIESRKCSLLLSFVEEEGRAICLRVLDAALPALVERYHEQVEKWGEEFTSGGLTLRRDALVYQEKEYPFHRIRGHRVQQGTFSFTVGKENNPVAEITTDSWNFPIFYALFKKLLEKAERD